MRFVQRAAPAGAPEASLPPEAYPAWFAALLRARGIRSEAEARAFLSPSLAGLHDPFLMPDMAKAADLLREAVRRRDLVLVWGDYDADGVCSAAILLETLQELGALAKFHLPDRRREGYGLNADGVRKAAEAGVKLLVTVDCGISSVQEAALAKSLGMTVIITDHHELPETLPEADAVLNPLLGGYPFPRLCGAGVALKIAQALQGLPGVEKRLDLAAIATVADIVPLQGENRVIVAEGLKRIASSPRPGLQALVRAAGLTPPITAMDLAFRLGPRLNAAGRLEGAAQAVTLLTRAQEPVAGQMAAKLDDLNAARQKQEMALVTAAQEQLARDFSPERDRVLVVAGEGWNPGLIGLAAGRLCKQYTLPAIVLSVREDGTAVGSCRSIPGVHIFALLSRCADLLVRFGGHAQAAGLTVEISALPALKSRLNGILLEETDPSVFVPSAEYDLVRQAGSWTEQDLRLLDQLEPTGCGNPPPVFLQPGAGLVSGRRVGSEGAHWKLRLRDADGFEVDGIAFNLGPDSERIGPRFDALYVPVRNTFGGRTRIEARIEAVSPLDPN